MGWPGALTKSQVSVDLGNLGGAGTSGDHGAGGGEQKLSVILTIWVKISLD